MLRQQPGAPGGSLVSTQSHCPVWHPNRVGVVCGDSAWEASPAGRAAGTPSPAAVRCGSGSSRISKLGVLQKSFLLIRGGTARAPGVGFGQRKGLGVSEAVQKFGGGWGSCILDSDPVPFFLAVAQKVVALRKKQQLSIGPCKSLPNSPSHSSVSAASIPSVHINQVGNGNRSSQGVPVLPTPEGTQYTACLA